MVIMMKNVKNRCLGNENVFDKIQKIKEVNLKQIMLIILIKKKFWIKNKEKII